MEWYFIVLFVVLFIIVNELIMGFIAFKMIFGRKLKLSEITEDQADLFELVIDEMKSL